MSDALSNARIRAQSWWDSTGTLTHEWPDIACDPATFEAVTRHDLPTLHLEDVSAIPFVSVIPGVEQYQHRARVRAYDGDIFAAVTPVSDGYEAYCRDALGLGSPQLVMADPVDIPTAVARACHRGAGWDAVVEWARGHERVALHPYMAIRDVWELGAKLKAEVGNDVRVVGPTVDALWVANDKASLSDVAELAVGPGWIMETGRSNTVQGIAAEVARMAKMWNWVGLKRTRCASAMGNAVFDATRLRQMPTRELHAEVAHFLDRTEWAGDEDVLIVEWGETDISPSTQMWIPPLGAGDPILQGIYEQLLEGPEKVFLGSRPSTLSAAVHEDLRHASMLVSAAFQQLGYVGRCSFDFIVLGDPDGEFDVRFTECNGRWGGTSTPMSLVDRLGWRDENGRRPYHAQDYVDTDLIGASFHDLRRLLADELYDPASKRGRFVLYNVGPLAGNGKFDIISLGRTHEEAVEGIEVVVPELLR